MRMFSCLTAQTRFRVLTCVLASVASVAGAQTLHVAATGDDAGGDGSPGNPFLTISNGVAQVPAGGTVMVATGVYDVVVRILLDKAVRLRSWNEAAGGGEDRANTIIDGNDACAPLYITHSNAIASGFTITRGNAVRGVQNGRGGGVYLLGGTLSNCIVAGNYANNCGGGMEAGVNANALVVDCIISNNWLTNTALTTYGGGLYLRVGNTILNSLITSNAVAYNGGGIYAEANTIISNCTIAENKAEKSGYAYGAGVYIAGTNALMADCLVSNNNSTLCGGGVYVYSAGSLILRDSVITHNYALSTGGGLNVMRSRPECSTLVSNCVFSYNIGDASAGYGAGLADGYPFTTPHTSSGTLTVADCRIFGNHGGRYGGGVWIWTHGTSIIQNCEIVSNEVSMYGGGMTIGTGSACVVVQNCLIASNRSTISYAQGGGIFLNTNDTLSRHSGPNPLDLRVESCTIVDNLTQRDYGGIYVLSNHTEVLNCVIASNRCGATWNYPDLNPANKDAFYYSCSPELINTEQGNITNAPAFADFSAGNYRLDGQSPGVNAGTNRAWMAGAADLDGVMRIDRFAGRVDMGCYEYLPRGVLFQFR